MGMNLIVLDTETSDLPEKGGNLLEIAWLIMKPYGGQWVHDHAYEAYIQYSGPINPIAQASNHIRIDQLTAERGAISREAALSVLLNSICPGDFLVAHNADFDSKFLPEINKPWICTYRVAKKIWPEAPGHSNQVLRYWLGIEPDLSVAQTVRHRQPHEALYDVATTAGILGKMLTRHTPEELYKMTTTPNRLKTIPFGKHKGTDFNAVPKDYLVWLVGQSKLDPDVRYTIDCILKGVA